MNTDCDFHEMKFQLELKRIELEEKQRERQERDRERQLEERERQFQMTKLKMEYDLKALELTQQNSPALQNPTTQQPAFKVETAAKLLPKLSVDHELEVYLITFRKIAVLNNWPKEYWPAILQTQLKGKALRIFSELPESTIKDYEQLQSALLAAYELTPEHYRKKFREIRKCDSENYTDFAFKMQNYFKRWLQSVNSYDNVERLRQTFLMEQFLETVTTELKIWLVDQKPKTIDEMGKLADQYVALRKQVNQSQSSSVSSSETHQVVSHNRGVGNTSSTSQKTLSRITCAACGCSRFEFS